MRKPFALAKGSSVDLKNRVSMAEENLTSLNTDAEESKKKLDDIF